MTKPILEIKRNNKTSFLFPNAERVEEYGHVLPGIEIKADTLDDAERILQGMDGGRAFNAIRDLYV